MRVFILVSCFKSRRVSATLDHIGYPPPPLDQWQQCIWYDLGTAQESLHLMCNCLVQGLPAAASPTRVEPPSSFFKPATTPIHPKYGGKFVKASKGEGSTPGTVTAGPSLSTATTSPKTEKKKKKRWKATKRTVTSETVSSPEKRRKLVSESPDSEAEGPFRDSDRRVHQRAPPTSPSGDFSISLTTPLQRTALDGHDTSLFKNIFPALYVIN